MKYLLSWLIWNAKKILAAIAFLNFISPAVAAPVPQTVTGTTGGGVDSKSCGFVAATPSYTLSIDRRIDYLRMLVEAQGGQPTLLVVGPKNDDRFCILGDSSVGLDPEISGVWEPGSYSVYVGDREGAQHPFTLRILTDKN